MTAQFRAVSVGAPWRVLIGPSYGCREGIAIHGFGLFLPGSVWAVDHSAAQAVGGWRMDAGSAVAVWWWGLAGSYPG